VRRSVSQNLVNLNPFLVPNPTLVSCPTALVISCPDPGDWEVISLVYDTLLRANPLNSAQVIDWMTMGHRLTPSSSPTAWAVEAQKRPQVPRRCLGHVSRCLFFTEHVQDPHEPSCISLCITPWNFPDDQLCPG